MRDETLHDLSTDEHAAGHPDTSGECRCRGRLIGTCRRCGLPDVQASGACRPIRCTHAEWVECAVWRLVEGSHVMVGAEGEVITGQELIDVLRMLDEEARKRPSARLEGVVKRCPACGQRATCVYPERHASWMPS